MITLLASGAAFGVVFGIFVAALAVLAFLALRWGVRRDRSGREAWNQRRLEAADQARAAEGGLGDDLGPPS